MKSQDISNQNLPNNPLMKRTTMLNLLAMKRAARKKAEKLAQKNLQQNQPDKPNQK